MYLYVKKRGARTDKRASKMNESENQKSSAADSAAPRGVPMNASYPCVVVAIIIVKLGIDVTAAADEAAHAGAPKSKIGCDPPCCCCPVPHPPGESTLLRMPPPMPLPPAPASAPKRASKSRLTSISKRSKKSKGATRGKTSPKSSAPPPLPPPTLAPAHNPSVRGETIPPARRRVTRVDEGTRKNFRIWQIRQYRSRRTEGKARAPVRAAATATAMTVGEVMGMRTAEGRAEALVAAVGAVADLADVRRRRRRLGAEAWVAPRRAVRCCATVRPLVGSARVP